METFAAEKINITTMIISVFDWLKNILEQAEILVTNILFFSHVAFKSCIFMGH